MELERRATCATPQEPGGATGPEVESEEESMSEEEIDPLSIPCPLGARLIDAKFLPNHPLLEKIREMVRHTAEANLAEGRPIAPEET